MTHWFDAEDHASRALDMFERGRWAEAELELRHALAIQPDQPEWLFNLGLVLESSGRDRQARDVFERAADLVPDQIDVVTSAALACARLGDSDRAMRWFDQVLAVDPANEEAHARRIEMLVSQGRHDDAEAAFYLAEWTRDEPSGLCLLEVAVSLIARGHYRRAGWCLRQAMRLEPGLPRIRLRLAEVHASMGQLDRAIQLCAREVREDPGNLEALGLYAEMLEDAGRPVEAIEIFRRLLDFDRASVGAHAGLGRLLASLGHDQMALLEYQIVRKLDPAHLGVDLAVGELERKLGKPDAARISLLRAYERCCDQINALGGDAQELTRLARLLLSVDLATEAVVLMDAVCDQGCPIDDDTLRLLARARYRAGDLVGGMRISRRILRQDPECLVCHANLALAALERRRFQIAAAWVQRGLNFDPGDEMLRRLRLRCRLEWISAGCWPIVRTLQRWMKGRA